MYNPEREDSNQEYEWGHQRRTKEQSQTSGDLLGEIGGWRRTLGGIAIYSIDRRL